VYPAGFDTTLLRLRTARGFSAALPYPNFITEIFAGSGTF